MIHLKVNSEGCSPPSREGLGEGEKLIATFKGSTVCNKIARE